MQNTFPALAALLLAPLAAHSAAELRLTAPLDYQVVQRQSGGMGSIRIAGELPESGSSVTSVEARIHFGKAIEWRKLPGAFHGSKFFTVMDAPAGGWYRVDVRAVSGDKVLADSSVEHVGVGEVFVVAGQSNSANHGEEKQATKTGRVATFDGSNWQLANDPQPGASGAGGSFIPPFGDAISERFNVPVGFIACGIGATSVREWLPKGTVFPNPPTIESRVARLPDGEWKSTGEAFAMFTGRMEQLGPRSFRAVLWHQGESDANQGDPARTLPGSLYRKYLETVIRESRRAIGWEAPWFVAQVSYHVPGDEASPDIRAAQASLWKDGIAHEGPDTDAIKGDFREAGGKGVHFSGPGQREHAARWVEKVAPWLEQQLSLLSSSAWQAAEAPVYRDPDDDWAKDPSVIQVGDTYYMYYTSANPWQDQGRGGKGEPRIDYATSPDGLNWSYQGLSIPKGLPGEWDEERSQAPAKPILRDGVYYMYYAGKCAKKDVATGYATSTDLRHWTKNPDNPVLRNGKVNDPFVYVEDGIYYLFYTSGGDEVYYVTSTNLVNWPTKPVFTRAVGEGSIVLKDGPTFTLFACVGFSGNGEYYKAYSSRSLTDRFTDDGKIKINTPTFASGTLSHGDILRRGDEYWFYFQGTRDWGEHFQIGLAKQTVPKATSAKEPH